MGSIKNVVSEPIEGHEDYHMMVTGLAAVRNSVCVYITSFIGQS